MKSFLNGRNGSSADLKPLQTASDLYHQALEELPPELVEVPTPEQMEELQTKKKRQRRQQNQSANQTENTGSGDKAPKGRKSNVDKELERVKETLYPIVATVGIGVKMVNPVDGSIIIDKGTGVVDALCLVAKEDEQVRKALLMLTTGTVYTQLAIAVLALIVPILANHRLVPEVAAIPFGGVPRVDDDGFSIFGRTIPNASN